MAPITSADRKSRQENPIVFLDISIHNQPTGRFLIELRADIVPKTAENFRRLCTGETKNPDTGRKRHFLHCVFHRVVKHRFCQSGDFQNLDGTGGECAFDDDEEDSTAIISTASRTFADENFILQHTGPGVLSMVNTGPNSNASQFYLHFAANREFDDKHVVFGCLLGQESFHLLDKVHQVATERGDPKVPIEIIHCGQLFTPDDLLAAAPVSGSQC